MSTTQTSQNVFDVTRYANSLPFRIINMMSEIANTEVAHEGFGDMNGHFLSLQGKTREEVRAAVAERFGTLHATDALDVLQDACYGETFTELDVDAYLEMIDDTFARTYAKEELTTQEDIDRFEKHVVERNAEIKAELDAEGDIPEEVYESLERTMKLAAKSIAYAKEGLTPKC